MAPAQQPEPWCSDIDVRNRDNQRRYAQRREAYLRAKFRREAPPRFPVRIA